VLTEAEFTVYAKQASVTHPLPGGSILTVGRGARVHIRIDDVSVSREHLRIYVGKTIEVEDLGSSNGTLIFRAQDDQGVAACIRGEAARLVPFQRYPFQPGDVLRVGSIPALLKWNQAAPDGRATIAPAESERVVLRDPQMQRVYELAGRAAQSDISVLIMGETGVGKELLAAEVHARSRRSGRPLLQLNCAALSESLLESELFGYEKGAFTGANAARPGLFEATNGGTIFLDELGDMALSTQVKLLRVLEDRQIRRIGANRSVVVDVRFIAATNRDLEQDVARGRFRADLYYRISGIALHIPPLRERITEIEPLARHFLRTFCFANSVALPELTEAAADALRLYPWPGNVRELKNVMERAPFLSSGQAIEAEHIPRAAAVEDLFAENETTDVFNPTELSSLRSRTATTPRNGLVLPQATPPRRPPPTELDWDEIQDVRPLQMPPTAPTHGASERERVIQALQAADGNQTRAAAILGVSRRTLINRLESFSLPRPRKRAEGDEP